MSRSVGPSHPNLPQKSTIPPSPQLTNTLPAAQTPSELPKSSRKQKLRSSNHTSPVLQSAPLTTSPLFIMNPSNPHLTTNPIATQLLSPSPQFHADLNASTVHPIAPPLPRVLNHAELQQSAVGLSLNSHNPPNQAQSTQQPPPLLPPNHLHQPSSSAPLSLAQHAQPPPPPPPPSTYYLPISSTAGPFLISIAPKPFTRLQRDFREQEWLLDQELLHFQQWKERRKMAKLKQNQQHQNQYQNQEQSNDHNHSQLKSNNPKHPVDMLSEETLFEYLGNNPNTKLNPQSRSTHSTHSTCSDVNNYDFNRNTQPPKPQNNNILNSIPALLPNPSLQTQNSSNALPTAPPIPGSKISSGVSDVEIKPLGLSPLALPLNPLTSLNSMSLPDFSHGDHLGNNTSDRKYHTNNNNNNNPKYALRVNQMMANSSSSTNATITPFAFLVDPLAMTPPTTTKTITNEVEANKLDAQISSTFQTLPQLDQNISLSNTMTTHSANKKRIIIEEMGENATQRTQTHQSQRNLTSYPLSSHPSHRTLITTSPPTQYRENNQQTTHNATSSHLSPPNINAHATHPPQHQAYPSNLPPQRAPVQTHANRAATFMLKQPGLTIGQQQLLDQLKSIHQEHAAGPRNKRQSLRERERERDQKAFTTNSPNPQQQNQNPAHHPTLTTSSSNQNQIHKMLPDPSTAAQTQNSVLHNNNHPVQLPNTADAGTSAVSIRRIPNTHIVVGNIQNAMNSTQDPTNSTVSTQTMPGQGPSQITPTTAPDSNSKTKPKTKHRISIKSTALDQTRECEEIQKHSVEVFQQELEFYTAIQKKSGAEIYSPVQLVNGIPVAKPLNYAPSTGAALTNSPFMRATIGSLSGALEAVSPNTTRVLPNNLHSTHASPTLFQLAQLQSGSNNGGQSSHLKANSGPTSVRLAPASPPLTKSTPVHSGIPGPNSNHNTTTYNQQLQQLAQGPSSGVLKPSTNTTTSTTVSALSPHTSRPTTSPHQTASPHLKVASDVATTGATHSTPPQPEQLNTHGHIVQSNNKGYVTAGDFMNIHDFSGPLFQTKTHNHTHTQQPMTQAIQHANNNTNVSHTTTTTHTQPQHQPNPPTRRRQSQPQPQPQLPSQQPPQQTSPQRPLQLPPTTLTTTTDSTKVVPPPTTDPINANVHPSTTPATNGTTPGINFLAAPSVEKKRRTNANAQVDDLQAVTTTKNKKMRTARAPKGQKGKAAADTTVQLELNKTIDLDSLRQDDSSDIVKDRDNHFAGESGFGQLDDFDFDVASLTKKQQQLSGLDAFGLDSFPNSTFSSTQDGAIKRNRNGIAKR